MMYLIKKETSKGISYFQDGIGIGTQMWVRHPGKATWYDTEHEATEFKEDINESVDVYNITIIQHPLSLARNELKTL